MERERSVFEASIDLRSRSFTEGTRPIVQLSDLPENRDAFKTDQTCLLCGYTFGTLLSLVYSQKCCCMFCYTGVCSKCSPHKLLHPETNELERCCTSCYNKLISQSIRSDLQIELSRRQAKLKTLMKEIEKVQQAKEAEAAEIKALEEHVQMRERQLAEQRVTAEMRVTRYRHDDEALRTALAAAEAEHKTNEGLIKRLHPKLRELKQKIERLKRQEEADQRKWEDIIARIKEVTIDVEELKEQLRLDPPPTVSEDLGENNPRALELQQAVALELDLLVKLQQQNLSLTEKLSASKKTELDISRRRRSSMREAELSATVPAFPRDPAELKSRTLSLQLEAQKLASELERVKQGPEDSELRELRSAIMKEKEENKQMLLSFQQRLLTDGRRETVSRDKCGCSSF